MADEIENMMQSVDPEGNFNKISDGTSVQSHEQTIADETMGDVPTTEDSGEESAPIPGELSDESDTHNEVSDDIDYLPDINEETYNEVMADTITNSRELVGYYPILYTIYHVDVSHCTHRDLHQVHHHILQSTKIFSSLSPAYDPGHHRHLSIFPELYRPKLSRV